MISCVDFVLFLQDLVYLGMAAQITLHTIPALITPRSLLLLPPDAGHLEHPRLLRLARACHRDVQAQEDPGGEHTQHQDAEHGVAVDEAVHDAEHDAILPSLKENCTQYQGELKGQLNCFLH